MKLQGKLMKVNLDENGDNISSMLGVDAEAISKIIDGYDGSNVNMAFKDIIFNDKFTDNMRIALLVGLGGQLVVQAINKQQEEINAMNTLFVGQGIH